MQRDLTALKSIKVIIYISYNTPGRDVPSAECLYVGYIPPRGVISDLLYTARWLRRPAAVMVLAIGN